MALRERFSGTFHGPESCSDSREAVVMLPPLNDPSEIRYFYGPMNDFILFSLLLESWTTKSCHGTIFNKY